MQDLELLRAFRAETPQLSDERVRLIREAYRTPATTSPARPRSGRRLALLALVAALVAAVLLAVETRGQESAAAAVLHHAAAQLDTTPTSPLPVGSYWYIRTSERVLSETSYRVDGADKLAALFTDETAETWLGNDGSGAQRATRSAPFGLTRAARQAMREFARTQSAPSYAPGFIFDGPGLLSGSLGNRHLTPSNLSSLPTDPAALRELVASVHISPPTTPHELAVAEFQEISNALFFEPFDQTLTAALYRILATLPGVESLGRVEDAASRKGVEIAIENGTTRMSLVLDPNTGQLLERRETKIASNADDSQVPIGTETWRETIVRTFLAPGLAVLPDGTRLDTTHWTICKPDPQPGSPDEAHCVDR
jgi:hypothetical protein